MNSTDLIATANLADKTDRAMLADLLVDEGRDSVVSLLRSKTQLLVDDGVVRAWTALDLLDAARNGDLSAEVINEESVPALAGRDGADCYPTVTLEITATRGPNSWTADVVGWKVVRLVEGPNDPLNGRYLGEGWHELVETDDGASRGRPEVQVDHDGQVPVISIHPGDNVGRTTLIPADDLTSEEADELANAISDAIEVAYEVWSPELPSDSDIYAAILDTRPDDTLTDSVVAGQDEDGDDVEVEAEIDVFSGTHMGRTYWVIDDVSDDENTLYDSSREAYRVARSVLADRLYAKVEAWREEQEEG